VRSYEKNSRSRRYLKAAEEQYNSNGRRFKYRVPTPAWRLGNHVRGARFVKIEVTTSVTEAKVNRHYDRAVKDAKILSRPFNIEHIFNPVYRRIRIAWRLVQAAGRSKGKEMYDLVLTEESDQSVA
jgi:hypothetical protein